jgi:ribonucleoside-diphosphate reductase beta chain
MPYASDAAATFADENFFETRVIEYQNGGALSWD